jgi:hypothetical protein
MSYAEKIANSIITIKSFLDNADDTTLKYLKMMPEQRDKLHEYSFLISKNFDSLFTGQITHHESPPPYVQVFYGPCIEHLDQIMTTKFMAHEFGHIIFHKNLPKRKYQCRMEEFEADEFSDRLIPEIHSGKLLKSIYSANPNGHSDIRCTLLFNKIISGFPLGPLCHSLSSHPSYFSRTLVSRYHCKKFLKQKK